MARISVTLPREMIDDLKDKSSRTGLSVSRLAYLRLRERAPIVIVGQEVLAAIRELQAKLDEARAMGGLPVEVLGVLQRHADFYAKLVDVNSGKVNKITGKDTANGTEKSGYIADCFAKSKRQS